MKESRKYRRIDAHECAVTIELRYANSVTPEERRTSYCSTGDLSTHGLRLHLDAPLEPETPVRVTVVFQQPAHHFEHIGSVRWVCAADNGEGYLVGIEFAGKRRAEMYAWREFLDARYPAVIAPASSHWPTPGA